MDKAATKDYLEHLENIGMKDSAEYKRILAKSTSEPVVKKVKKPSENKTIEQ